MISNSPHTNALKPEVGTPTHPLPILEFLKTLELSGVQYSDPQGVRIELQLNDQAIDDAIDAQCAKVERVVRAQHPLPQDDDIVSKSLHGYKASAYAAVTDQLITSRTTAYSSQIAPQNKTTVIKSKPYLPDDIIDQIHQIGDYHADNGNVTAQKSFNKSIVNYTMKALSSAVATFTQQEMFEGSSIPVAHRAQIVEALGTVLDDDEEPLFLTGDEIGTEVSAYAIGEGYENFINNDVPQNVKQAACFVDKEHIVEMFTTVREGMQTGAIQRDNQPIPRNQITDTFVSGTIVKIMFNGQELDNDVSEQLVAYVNAMAGRDDESKQARTDILLQQGVKIVPELRLRQVFELLNRFVNLYNQIGVKTILSSVKSKFSEFYPTEGGSPAMLVRRYHEDRRVSVYKAPYGITKAQRFYGFMLGITQEAIFKEVEVHVKHDRIVLLNMLIDTLGRKKG